MLNIVLEASFAFWWIYLVVSAGFALALLPLVARRLAPGLWLGASVVGLVLVALAGPFLVAFFFGRCDSEGGKSATYVWLYLALALACVAAFFAGAATAGLWRRSRLLALGVVVPVSIVSTMLAYMAFIFLAFGAEKCLL